MPTCFIQVGVSQQHLRLFTVGFEMYAHLHKQA